VQTIMPRIDAFISIDLNMHFFHVYSHVELTYAKALLKHQNQLARDRPT